MKKTMAGSAGMDRRVSFALRDCSLGLALIGSSAAGLCALMLGDDREALLRAARARFPDAETGEGGFRESGGPRAGTD
jgi:AraC family transcriptional regulator of adaptative response/methylated-DNA-[protein]-cysteine methyltransferase